MEFHGEKFMQIEFSRKEFGKSEEIILRRKFMEYLMLEWFLLGPKATIFDGVEIKKK